MNLSVPLISRTLFAIGFITLFGASGSEGAGQLSVSIAPHSNTPRWVHISIAGTEAVQYNVQRSLNLRDWVVIATLPGTGGSIAFDDSALGTAAQAYYRVGASASASQLRTQNIWIALRSDGLTGSGTQADPFDGSTPEKFDGVLSRFIGTPNLGVHLVGAGPFRTDVHHTWWVRSGWVISGEGMYSTTVQLVGNLAGSTWTRVFSSDPNVATDNVTIRDLTIDCNWPEIGSTATDGLGGEKLCTLNAVMLCGSNNLIERVRHINSYGSWENRKEGFAMFLTVPPNGPGTNNIIRDCRAELPQGTYGNPFALAGSAAYPITNSKVLGCTAVGINDGLNHGFTSGGVNLSYVKDCQIDSNTFIDCYGAAYIDVGSLDGLRITNNIVVRGWMGIGLRCPILKQNVTISGNSFNIQNRGPGGASLAIYVDNGPISNVTIDSNTLSFDTSGLGIAEFWGFGVYAATNATISNNTIGTVNATLYDRVLGAAITFSNNLMSDGSAIYWLGP